MHVQLSNGKLLNLIYFEDAKQGFHDKKIVVIYLTNGTKFIERFATEEEAEQEAELIREAAKAGGGLLQKDSLNDFPKTGNSGTIYIAKDTGQTYYWDKISKTYIKTGTAGRTGVYSYNKDLPSVVGTSIVVKKSELNEILKPSVDYSEGSEVIGNNSIHGIITKVDGDNVTVSTITDMTIDSFRQVATLNDLPTSGVDNILYYVQDIDEFRIWDSTNGKWVEPFHPVIFNNVPAIADARLNTLYIDGDIIKYTPDNVTWVEISGRAAMKEYLSDVDLITTILGKTTINITDISVSNINDIELEQLVYDNKGTVGRIIKIDLTTKDIEVETITIAGSGSGAPGMPIAPDTKELKIKNGGNSYTVGDIVESTTTGIFAEVTSVDSNGIILDVTDTTATAQSTSGTGAVIDYEQIIYGGYGTNWAALSDTAVLDPQVFYWDGKIDQTGLDFWNNVMQINDTTDVLVVVIGKSMSDMNHLELIKVPKNSIRTNKQTDYFNYIVYNNVDVFTNSNSTYSIYSTYLQFTIENDIITSILKPTTGALNVQFLGTDVNYSTPYEPQYPGSPATKKYVDDSIATNITNVLNRSY